MWNSLKTKATGVLESIGQKHDKYKTLIEMVTDHDFPIEKYFYKTQDGYINCVYRISGAKGTKAWDNEKLNLKKPVVIYQHGFLDSAASICCDGQKSMAFQFAQEGFDVWMNNTRGNRFSRHHTWMDPDSNPEFWNFSFDEMAKYDQPALFDFVLKKTGVESVSYIGHSQGTQQIFAALIDNAEFFKPKINVAIMLAPVTRVDRMTCGSVHKLKDNDKLFELLEKTQGNEVMALPSVDGKISSGFLKATGAG